MKTKDMKRGISLIVLVITIIVVIILAAVVVLTLSKNNPIESAKEARFKEDVRTFQDELALYISKQYVNAGGHWDENISAKSFNDIVEYIPSFTKKYEGKFLINNNNLEYTNKLDEKEKEYAQNLNVRERIKLLPDEFQQVEYIESTGTQYIDTTIYFDFTKDFRIVGSAINPDSSKRKVIIGSYIKHNSISYSIEFCNSSNSKPGDLRNFFQSGTDSKDIFSSESIPVNTLLHYDTIYDSTNKEVTTKYYYNNITQAYNGKVMNVNTSSINPLRFFLDYRSNISVISHSLSIGETRIYQGNILVGDFIPCYCTTTVTNLDGDECDAGTVGLYDTVEGKFYTNQGTGEFIAGPDVNE